MKKTASEIKEEIRDEIKAGWSSQFTRRSNEEFATRMIEKFSKVVINKKMVYISNMTKERVG